MRTARTLLVRRARPVRLLGAAEISLPCLDRGERRWGSDVALIDGRGYVARLEAVGQRGDDCCETPLKTREEKKGLQEPVFMR